ncbi:hypothetical protein BJX61DRAFT_337417 [Aspergillus egyptiacus]|nr:hypothetical protein BJX61DRAFT_337417 [Aspergillus egyptiacus]
MLRNRMPIIDRLLTSTLRENSQWTLDIPITEPDETKAPESSLSRSLSILECELTKVCEHGTRKAETSLELLSLKTCLVGSIPHLDKAILVPWDSLQNSATFLALPRESLTGTRHAGEWHGSRRFDKKKAPATIRYQITMFEWMVDTTWTVRASVSDSE